MTLPALTLESLANEKKYPPLYGGGHIRIMQKCIFSLDCKGHDSGVILDVENEIGNCQYILTWNTPADDRLRNAHADKVESVEDSALAISFLVATEVTPYIVLRQALRGSAIDYYLAESDCQLPFQNAAGLECSGILSGTESDIASRIKEKKRRLKSKHDLPVYIAVVEHSFPSVKIEKVLP